MDVSKTTPQSEPCLQPKPRLEGYALQRGLDSAIVEAQLAAFARIADISKYALSFLLAETAERRLYQVHGYPDVLRYAQYVHGLERRRTQEFVRVGRALFDLPRIDALFRDGELGWSKVLLLSRVATPEHEAAWIRVAKRCTCEQLDIEVRLARSDGAPRDPQQRKGLPEIRFTWITQLDPLTREMVEKAQRKLGDERGSALTGNEFLRAVCELVLASDENGEVPGRTRVDASLYRIHLEAKGSSEDAPDEEHNDGPALSLVRDGVEIPIADGETVSCQADHVHDDGRLAPPTPPALRRRVLRRDRKACRSCGSGRGLMAHHIVYRSRGGATTLDNLITLCTSCHALVHEDLLVIEGKNATNARFVDAQDQAVGADAARAAHATRRARDTLRLAHLVPSHLVPEGLPDSGNKATASEPVPVPFEEAFAEIVGQDELLDRIRRTAEGADALGKAYPHTLFWGPPGTGKTTFASALAAYRGATLHTTTGPLLRDPAALPAMLAGFRQDDLLFIDEIHATPVAVLEVLYEAMTANRISHAGLGSGVTEVPRFTLLAATTEPGSLSTALRSRFGMVESLDFHGLEQLAEIATKYAGRDEITLAPGCGQGLAEMSRGTPREVMRLLDMAMRQAAQAGRRQIEDQDVEAIRGDLGLDARGLRREEQRYIAALEHSSDPVPLGRLAEQLGTDPNTLTRTIEPYLFFRKLVRTTRRGRALLGRSLQPSRSAFGLVCEGHGLQLLA